MSLQLVTNQPWLQRGYCVTRCVKLSAWREGWRHHQDGSLGRTTTYCWRACWLLSEAHHYNSCLRTVSHSDLHKTDLGHRKNGRKSTLPIWKRVSISQFMFSFTRALHTVDLSSRIAYAISQSKAHSTTQIVSILINRLIMKNSFMTCSCFNLYWYNCSDNGTQIL